MTRKFITFILMTTMVLSMMTACGSNNSRESSEKSSDVITSEDFAYIASNIYWSGEKLIVEGDIYNLSSTYDVTDIEEAVIYVYDEDATLVLECNVNENYLTSIPHGSSAAYNFTSKNVSSYKGTTNFCMTVELSGDYEVCQGGNCSLCARWSSGSSGGSGSGGETCTACNGTGYGMLTCTNCSGTGIEPLWEQTKGKSMHSFVEKECYKCSGTGKANVRPAAAWESFTENNNAVECMNFGVKIFRCCLRTYSSAYSRSR